MTVEEIYNELDLIDARIEEMGQAMREAISKIQDEYQAEYKELADKRRSLDKELNSLNLN